MMMGRKALTQQQNYFFNFYLINHFKKNQMTLIMCLIAQEKLFNAIPPPYHTHILFGNVT